MVQGNTIKAEVVSIGHSEIGGATSRPGTGAGNFLQSLYLEGSGERVQGNVIDGGRDWGILDLRANNTIGGTALADGNLIENSSPGESLGAQPGAYAGGIVIDYGESSRGGGNPTLIEHNVIRGNGADGGVVVYSGTGSQILANEMSGNTLGINLGGGPFHYNGTVSPPGPNDYLPYPVLYGATPHSGLEIQGQAPSSPGVRIQLYSQVSCAQSALTPGQGLHYLGSTFLPKGAPFGQFKLTFPSAPAGDHAVTVTATDSSGNTSEFSPCQKIGGRALSFTGSGAIPTSLNIPVTPNTSSAIDIARESAAMKKGHGALQLLCPPITTGSCVGTIVILTTGRHPITIARASFRLKPGFAKRITVTVPAKLLATLKRKHRITVKAVISAHDGAKQPHHKHATRNLNLVYR